MGENSPEDGGALGSGSGFSSTTTAWDLRAAFVLAFGTRRHWLQYYALAALGSGMVLDEIVFLVMTKASDGDHVSRLSLLGAAGSLLAALLLIWILHRFQRR